LTTAGLLPGSAGGADAVAAAPGLRARFGPAVALTLLLALVVALVPPRYEAGQNDDFAYVATVQQWLATGTLPDLGWNDPTLVFQFAWGALFALPFGASYATLRASTIVLAWLGALAFMALLRRCGARPAAAFVGGGLHLFHPLALVATWSFNSDVPYVALATIAALALVVACERRSLAWMVAAGLVVAAAFLVRQLGACVAIVGALWIGTRRDVTRRWSVAALLAWLAPIAIASEAHAHWLRAWRGGGWLPRFAVADPSSWTTSLTSAPLHAFACLATGALFTLPFALAAFARERGAAPSQSRGAFVAWTLLFGAVSFAAARSQPEGSRGWPYGGPGLTRAGPAFDLAGAQGTAGPAAFWWLATLAVPLAAAWWCGAVRSVATNARRDGLARSPVVLVVALGAAQLAPAFLVGEFYDRYVVVALPACFAVAALALPATRRAALAACAAFLVVAALSTEWLRAAVDRSKARWEVCEQAVAQGVDPRTIRGGLAWEGHHLWLEARAQLGLRGPWREWQRGAPWSSLQSIGTVVVEAHEAPRRALATRSYRPFLATEPLQVVALELRARKPGGGP